ncbi:type II toxin-antitoxin system RelE family toxin [Kamptonema formosum]|uniref:type II toxin-antitoxin system RelE family toxin n=1 Tax=Kamptonema formosum TaxID=331992 RepID=UPI000369DFBA|nr:type II toxin-antitoxin system RelE/ParE family toxin [Oscillatoria sp. PCC 10802]
MPQDSSYQIFFSPQARRALNALPQNQRSRINAKIQALAENPRPPGVKALQGYPGLLRIRAGEYRVIYRIEDDRLLVAVVRVGHRREIYRDL